MRCLLSEPLNGVGGAENGAAIVRPSRARSSVCTNVSIVAGNTVANRSGRFANPISPLAAMCSGLPPPAPATGCGAGASGCQTAQLGKQVRPGHAVDHGVVHLEHHRHRILAGAALDHPHLPQRAVAVQRQPGDVATDLGQLAPPSRRRHTDAVQMAPQLEILVVDPHRMIQVQLVVGELHPKFRHRAHAVDHVAAKPAVRVAPRHRRGIQLENTAHIQRLCRCLQIEKERVEST